MTSPLYIYIYMWFFVSSLVFLVVAIAIMRILGLSMLRPHAQCLYKHGIARKAPIWWNGREWV